MAPGLQVAFSGVHSDDSSRLMGTSRQHAAATVPHTAAVPKLLPGQTPLHGRVPAVPYPPPHLLALQTLDAMTDAASATAQQQQTGPYGMLPHYAADIQFPSTGLPQEPRVCAATSSPYTPAALVGQQQWPSHSQHAVVPQSASAHACLAGQLYGAHQPANVAAAMALQSGMVQTPYGGWVHKDTLSGVPAPLASACTHQGSTVQWSTAPCASVPTVLQGASKVANGGETAMAPGDARDSDETGCRSSTSQVEAAVCQHGWSSLTAGHGSVTAGASAQGGGDSCLLYTSPSPRD